jgi:integrase
MPRTATPRIWGPYKHRGAFQTVESDGDGERVYRTFETEGAATEYILEYRARLQHAAETTVIEAMNQYATYLLVDRGNRSNAETMRRLRLFFHTARFATVSDVKPRRAAKLFEEFSLRRKVSPSGKDLGPISVDYQRNALAEAKTFLRWCVRQGWASENALGHVEGKGKRKKGVESKQQLTKDEARRWLGKALERARTNGDAGALAAALTLVLDLRASEITRRLVRDLDDGGRLLRISGAKTARGNRVLEVPDVLRPLLVEQAKGRKTTALLFPAEPDPVTKRERPHWRDWVRENVQRICAAAGVVRVSAHAMRGAHASIAIEAGMSAHLVAAAMGHESEATTRASYIDPASDRRAKIDRAAQELGLRMVKGGRK